MTAVKNCPLDSADTRVTSVFMNRDCALKNEKEYISTLNTCPHYNERLLFSKELISTAAIVHNEISTFIGYPWIMNKRKTS